MHETTLWVTKQVPGKDYQGLGDRQMQRQKQQIKKAFNSSLNSFKEIGTGSHFI